MLHRVSPGNRGGGPGRPAMLYPPAIDGDPYRRHAQAPKRVAGMPAPVAGRAYGEPPTPADHGTPAKPSPAFTVRRGQRPGRRAG
jgi:hypothetical protein